jgi:hypothetical protein
MFKVDLIGRVGNVPLGQHRPLLPLFEAVVNSIHAIQAAKRKDGQIDIYVKRDETQSPPLDGFMDTRPVIEFKIIDNGIGFDEENFESFSTSDTKHKPGAKGIGRFMWLKAFDLVQIKSIYKSNGDYYKRTFNFLLSNNGIETPKNLKVDKGELKTEVDLIGYKEKYQKTCPKHLELIAERLIEHCLVYFLSDKCPRITIQDKSSSINLNEHFNLNVKDKTNSVTFAVQTESFKLTHLRLYFSNDRNHEAYICGNERVVESWDLGKRIPDLRAKLYDDDNNQFKYAACVVSRYLDDNVNVERVGFNIPREKESVPKEKDNLFEDVVSVEEIDTELTAQIKKYLDLYLKPVKESKAKRINHFVDTKAPQYRSTIKYMPNALDQIAPDISDEKLDIELHKLKSKFNIELKEQTQHLIDSTTDDIQDVNEYLDEYNKLLPKISELSTDQLAEYVLYRKAIISLLSKSLKIRSTDSYFLEEAIHRLIYPMRKSTSDVDYEQHNLWLIDERLSYHYFLSSDQRLDQMEVIESDSYDRPDIIVFNKALAYAESSPPFNSIVIIEFKRPMRDDYSIDDNPFEQVNRYISNCCYAVKRANDKLDLWINPCSTSTPII